MKTTIRRIILGFVCLVVITALSDWGSLSPAQQNLPSARNLTSLGQPSTRILSIGDIQFSSIYLDGVSLFQVASEKTSPSESEPQGSLSPIERRTRRVERTLRGIVELGFDPETLEVKPAILNNLTVIIASDQVNLSRRVVVTVTELDAQLVSSSIEDLAEQWSQTIREALIQAWLSRQPEARKRQLTMAAKIISGMIIVSIFLLLGQGWLKKRFKILQKERTKQLSTSLKSKAQLLSEKTDSLFPQPMEVLGKFRQHTTLEQMLTLNILLQRLNQIGIVLLWFSGVSAILYVFPETRVEGRGLFFIPLRVFIIWLVLTLISNLGILYVNHRLREWVEEGAVVSSDPQRRILRSRTLLSVSRGIIWFLAWFVGIIWFLTWKGVFPSSLLAGAGILGAALTFVFQSLLKDWVNGILIIFEDQYAVSDIIVFEGLIGIVEDMSLRATQIRTLDGRLSTIPHNQITIGHNLSKDWSRVNFSVEVAYDTDPLVAIALMKQVAQEMAQDLEWREDIIDPVSLIGVNRIAHSGIEIMMWIQVKRLRQLFVEQEFRRRLKQAFDDNGIQIGIPQQNILLAKNLGEKELGNRE